MNESSGYLLFFLRIIGQANTWNNRKGENAVIDPSVQERKKNLPYPYSLPSLRATMKNPAAMNAATHAHTGNGTNAMEGVRPT